MLRGTRSPQHCKLSESGSERGASTLTRISSSPPDPSPQHAMVQGLTPRDPQARRLLPLNTGVLHRARPAAPYGTPGYRSTRQAALASGDRTEAPTRTPPDLQGTARYGTQQVRHRAGQTSRPADTSTSTAPPRRRSNLGLRIGSVAMHQRGPKGPCDQPGYTYDRHKRS